jgi:hypothetical protein
MTVAEKVTTKLGTLSEQQQQQVLEFIEQLQNRAKQPLFDPYGLFAGYDTDEKEIAEARREMWGTFPREDM